MADTEVYFVTNRAPGPPGAPPARAFGPKMVPLENRALSFGKALVTKVTGDPATLEQQQVAEVSGVTQDFFSEALQAEIVNSGKNLLVFVHGFANSYSDAMCRAAFNREWFANSHMPAADCCVVAFTWPSAGRVVDGEDVLAGAATILLTVLGLAISHELKSPFTNRYHDDQNNARSSGRDFARTLDRMAPLAAQVRAQGRKVFLLAHSMGHVVLQGAFAGWANSGQAPSLRFDEAILAAADADAEFARQPPVWLTAMPRLTGRTSLYHSTEDQILMVSDVVNGKRRLGQSGPPSKADTQTFPPDNFRFVDCAGVQDPVEERQLDYTHQYYRRIPEVRDDIAEAFAGAGQPGQVVLGD